MFCLQGSGVLSHLVRHQDQIKEVFGHGEVMSSQARLKWATVSQLAIAHPALFLAAVDKYVARKKSSSGSLRNFVVDTLATMGTKLAARGQFKFTHQLL